MGAGMHGTAARRTRDVGEIDARYTPIRPERVGLTGLGEGVAETDRGGDATQDVEARGDEEAGGREHAEEDGEEDG